MLGQSVFHGFLAMTLGGTGQVACWCVGSRADSSRRALDCAQQTSGRCFSMDRGSERERCGSERAVAIERCREPMAATRRGRNLKREVEKAESDSRTMKAQL